MRQLRSTNIQHFATQDKIVANFVPTCRCGRETVMPESTPRDFESGRQFPVSGHWLTTRLTDRLTFGTVTLLQRGNYRM